MTGTTTLGQQMRVREALEDKASDGWPTCRLDSNPYRSKSPQHAAGGKMQIPRGIIAYVELSLKTAKRRSRKSGRRGGKLWKSIKLKEDKNEAKGKRGETGAVGAQPSRNAGQP